MGPKTNDSHITRVKARLAKGIKKKQTYKHKLDKRRKTNRTRQIKGDGLGALFGIAIRGIARGAPAIARAARVAGRAGLKIAKNKNTWKTLAKHAATQAASAAATEGVNAITRAIQRKKQRPKPAWSLGAEYY